MTPEFAGEVVIATGLRRAAKVIIPAIEGEIELDGIIIESCRVRIPEGLVEMDRLVQVAREPHNMNTGGFIVSPIWKRLRSDVPVYKKTAVSEYHPHEDGWNNRGILLANFREVNNE